MSKHHNLLPSGLSSVDSVYLANHNRCVNNMKTSNQPLSVLNGIKKKAKILPCAVNLSSVSLFLSTRAGFYKAEQSWRRGNPRSVVVDWYRAALLYNSASSVRTRHYFSSLTPMLPLRIHFLFY